jgi:hypothetical protein
VHGAVRGLVRDARICAAGVVKAAEYDRHESKQSKPGSNGAALLMFLSPLTILANMTQHVEDQ